jgi:hypothetical protein
MVGWRQCVLCGKQEAWRVCQRSRACSRREGHDGACGALAEPEPEVPAASHHHYFAGAASCIIDDCGARPNEVYDQLTRHPPCAAKINGKVCGAEKDDVRHEWPPVNPPPGPPALPSARGHSYLHPDVAMANARRPTTDEVPAAKVAEEIAERLIVAGVWTYWFRAQSEEGARGYLENWVSAVLSRYRVTERTR